MKNCGSYIEEPTVLQVEKVLKFFRRSYPKLDFEAVIMQQENIRANGRNNQELMPGIFRTKGWQKITLARIVGYDSTRKV